MPRPIVRGATESAFRRELRRRRRPYRLAPTILTLALTTGASLLAIAVSAIVLPVLLPSFGSISTPSSPARLCTGIAVYAAATVVVFRRLPSLARRSKRELGLCRPPPEALAAALGATVVLFGIEAVALGPYLMLVHATGHVQAGFERYAPQGWVANLLGFVSIAVAAPLAEELVFRAVIFTRWPFASERLGRQPAAV